VKKNLAQRDKVVFISLIDILLQLTFVLLIVILFIYKDNESMIFTISSLQEASKEAGSCTTEKDQCKAELLDLKKQYLQACIPASKTSALPSVKFKAQSTSTVIFEEFTPDYYKYIAAKGDKTREAKARSMKLGSQISLDEVESMFSFIREGDCYHEFTVFPIASINSVESSRVWGRISPTFKKLQY
jgi:hypothetical protein